MSARGRAWRSLGTCVRIAHEIELHLTDATSQSKPAAEQNALTHVGSWSQKEEQRRAWWVICELDIFASTVRRRPTSIHAGEHAVLLPISDAVWFDGCHQTSCFLDPDPLHRTRKLLESGNRSPKAWYLLVNSLIHDAHVTANPSAPRDRIPCRQDTGPLPAMASPEPVDERRLAVLDDFLLHFKTVLPKNLAYQGDYLSFSTSKAYGEPTVHQDFHVQLIQSMVHLGKLITYHHFCCRTASPLRPGDQNLTEYLSFSHTSVTQKLRAVLGFTDDQIAWDKYLGAAEEIMRVVRNASADHIRYGHPLLASTYWIVAATQLFKRAFARDEAEEELAQSNLDLLRLTLDRSRRFWNTSDMMIKNIDTLDGRLAELKTRLTDSHMRIQKTAISTGEDRVHDMRTFPSTVLPLQPHSGREDDVTGKRSYENASIDSLVCGSSYNTANELQISQGTTTGTEHLKYDELQAFMYDFCPETWDIWDSELADIFPLKMT